MKPVTGHPFDRSPACCQVCHTVVTLEALEAGVPVVEGKWLRVGQVADLLGVSVGTARNYIDAGKLGKVRRLSAGDRRVRSEAVDEYIRQIEEDQGDPDSSPDRRGDAD